MGYALFDWILEDKGGFRHGQHLTGKYGIFTPHQWPAFATHKEKFTNTKDLFARFTIAHTSKSQNTKADKLAKGVQALPIDSIYVNSVSPVWVFEPL